MTLTGGALRRLVRGRERRALNYSGPYADWAEAVAQSSGYDASVILEKVIAACREVRDGRAAYERDSALFAEPDAAYPALACVLRAAQACGGGLRVVDVGGALGSFYMQHRNWLTDLEPLRWRVVEQPGFVASGRAEFETPVLSFHQSVAEAAAEEPPDLAFLSSVLHYIEDFDSVLSKVEAGPARFLLIDRTPVSAAAEHRIFVQTVPPKIYEASYPMRVFSRTLFEARLAQRWHRLACFRALDGRAEAPEIGRIDHLGWFLERRP